MDEGKATRIFDHSGGKKDIGLDELFNSAALAKYSQAIRDEINTVETEAAPIVIGVPEDRELKRLEDRATIAFKRLSDIVPETAKKLFYEDLIIAASRQHYFAYNPFLIALSSVNLAAYYKKIAADPEKKRIMNAMFPEVISELSSAIPSLSELKHNALERFPNFGNGIFRTSELYLAARHSVNALKSLKIPPEYTKDSSLELAKTFWAYLPEYHSPIEEIAKKHLIEIKLIC